MYMMREAVTITYSVQKKVPDYSLFGPKLFLFNPA